MNRTWFHQTSRIDKEERALNLHFARPQISAFITSWFPAASPFTRLTIEIRNRGGGRASVAIPSAVSIVCNLSKHLFNFLFQQLPQPQQFIGFSARMRNTLPQKEHCTTRAHRNDYRVLEQVNSLIGTDLRIGSQDDNQNGFAGQ